MKLATYNPSVNLNTIGNTRIVAPDAGAAGRITGQALQGLGGVFARLADEKQTSDVTAAQTEYAKRISDVLYNEENGLMHRQLQAADGVSLAYQDAEQKIRQDVQKEFRLSGKGLQAFGAMCDKDVASHWGRINQHEFNEGEKNKKIVTDNAIVQIGNEAQNLYSDADAMDNALGKMRSVIDANYYYMGKDYCDAYYRQASSNLVMSDLNIAIRKNDMAGAEMIMSKYGYLVPPEKLSPYAKAVREYIRENQQIANTDRLYQKYGNNIKGAFEEIENDATTEIPPSGSIQEQAMAAAMYVEKKSKGRIPAALVYGQWVHETGNFTSRLTKENFNLGGLTQTTPNGEENKQPDGGNYYKKYNSIKEYADDYVKSFLDLYDYTGKNIKTPQDFARLLKENGYYTDDEGRYASGIASGMRSFNPDLVKGDPASVKKQEEAYLAKVSQQKRIKGLEQDAAVDRAWELYYTAGADADPRAIAQEVGGTDVVLTNTIANMLANEKAKTSKKGLDAAEMDTVTRMLQYGDAFNSVAELTAFAQNHGASYEQINKLQNMWKQKLNGEGIFAYPKLDSYISAAIENDGPKKSKARSIYLRQFAIDYINSYRRDNKRDPSMEELQNALTKEFTDKKIVLNAEGQQVTFTPIELTAKGIVSADIAYDVEGNNTGMVKVRYRDTDPQGRGGVTYVPIRQFQQDLGEQGSTNWRQLLSNPWTSNLYNPFMPGQTITNRVVDFAKE